MCFSFLLLLRRICVCVLKEEKDGGGRRHIKTKNVYNILRAAEGAYLSLSCPSATAVFFIFNSFLQPLPTKKDRSSSSSLCCANSSYLLHTHFDGRTTIISSTLFCAVLCAFFHQRTNTQRPTDRHSLLL